MTTRPNIPYEYLREYWETRGSFNEPHYKKVVQERTKRGIFLNYVSAKTRRWALSIIGFYNLKKKQVPMGKIKKVVERIESKNK